MLTPGGPIEVSLFCIINSHCKIHCKAIRQFGELRLDIQKVRQVKGKLDSPSRLNCRVVCERQAWSRDWDCNWDWESEWLKVHFVS